MDCANFLPSGGLTGYGHCAGEPICHELENEWVMTQENAPSQENLLLSKEILFEIFSRSDYASFSRMLTTCKLFYNCNFLLNSSREWVYNKCYNDTSWENLCKFPLTKTSKDSLPLRIVQILGRLSKTYGQCLGEAYSLIHVPPGLTIESLKVLCPKLKVDGKIENETPIESCWALVAKSKVSVLAPKAPASIPAPVSIPVPTPAPVMTKKKSLFYSSIAFSQSSLDQEMKKVDRFLEDYACSVKQLIASEPLIMGIAHQIKSCKVLLEGGGLPPAAVLLAARYLDREKLIDNVWIRCRDCYIRFLHGDRVEIQSFVQQKVEIIPMIIISNSK